MTTVLTCSACSAQITGADRFCAACGTRVVTRDQTVTSPPPDLRPGGEGSPVDAVTRRIVRREQAAASSGSLLAVVAPICAACGIDLEGRPDSCPDCGVATSMPTAAPENKLGITYSVRRGLRKRHFVRIADGDGVVRALFESGEEEIALDEMPEPDEQQLGDLVRPRTSAGRLLAVATACEAGSTKRRWDPQTLEQAAVDAAPDIASTRGLALDALDLGRRQFLEELALTPPERVWLQAVEAAVAGDHEDLVSALRALPPTRYRPKLVLLATALGAARAGGVDTGGLAEQLVSFADTEPLACLMLRILNEDRVEPTAAGLEASRRLLEAASPSPASACQIAAGIDALMGRTVTVPEDSSALGANTRALLALSSKREGLLSDADIDSLPLPVLDDLIDSGALGAETVLAGSSVGHRTRYLKARLDPAALDDAEVDGLDHHEERARRAFRNGDAERLAALGDSPTVSHYQTLLTLQSGKAGRQALESVRPEAREVVRDLLALAETKGRPEGATAALTERLIADSSVWPVLAEIAGSTAFSPDAEMLARYPAFCEWLALHRAREHLFLGEWQKAVAAADHCLSLATMEAVRDEALNLKACGLHYLGEDGRAIGALEEAVGGERSESLLANLGIVAARLDPELAARHLGMLMDEAPTVELRVAAAKRALEIWQSSEPGSWRNSDNSPLPDAFEDPTRRLVTADLDLDDFRFIAGVLAIYDSEWLAGAGSLATSPHKDTLEAKFFVARAQDLHEMIKVMGAAMRDGATPQWILDERDSLRSAAIDILFENLDEPDSTFGSVALEMVDQRVLAEKEDEVLFTGLGIAGVTYHLTTQHQEVADRIVSMVHTLREDWQRLEASAKERLDPIVELATRRAAINRFQARASAHDQAIDVFNSALDLGGRAQPGSPAYTEALNRVHTVVGVCRQIRDEMRPWVPIVDHEGVRNDIDQLVESTRKLEARCLEILN